MAENLTNGATTTLNGAITNSDSSLTLTSASGFPAAPFRIKIKAEGANTDEYILVGARSGTSCTSLTRAVEPIADGTQTATAHASGATVTQVLTYQGIRDLTLSTGTIGAKVSRTTTQNPGGSYAAIGFDAELYDTDGFHDNSVANTKLTIPAGLSGKYLMALSCSSHAGNGYIAIRKNGSTYLAFNSAASGAASVSIVADLVAGDYIEAADSGSGNSVYSEPDGLSITKLDSGRVGSGVGAKVYHSTTQNLTGGVTLYLSFDSETFDTDGFHDTSTGNNKLTIPTGMGGKYIIIGHVEVTASPGTSNYIAIRKNGSTFIGWQNIPNDGGAGLANVTTVDDLVAGDYVEFGVRVQGSSKATVTSDIGAPLFEIMRLDSNIPVGHGQAGTTTIGASWDASTQQVMKKITLANDSFVTAINAYVKSNSTVSNFTAYVMSDNSGTPYRVRTVPHGTRDSGATGGLEYGLDIDSNGRWLGIPIGVFLTAGTYWICVNAVAASGSSCQIAYDTGGSDRTRSGTDVAYDEAVSASSSGSNNYSVYADILR